MATEGYKNIRVIGKGHTQERGITTILALSEKELELYQGSFLTELGMGEKETLKEKDRQTRAKIIFQNIFFRYLDLVGLCPDYATICPTLPHDKYVSIDVSCFPTKTLLSPGGLNEAVHHLTFLVFPGQRETIQALCEFDFLGNKPGFCGFLACLTKIRYLGKPEPESEKITILQEERNPDRIQVAPIHRAAGFIKKMSEMRECLGKDRITELLQAERIYRTTPLWMKQATKEALTKRFMDYLGFDFGE
jgi:hypothetical protein